jgi:uncharacterized membrane protein
MPPLVNEWINLIVRWVHVFAGVLWVGQTYYFTWLDGQFSKQEAAGGAHDQVWMVHSGGFYVVDKKKTLAVDPSQVRWFRWEAFTTWVSGIILLTLVYYMGGIMVDDSVANISLGRAILIGVLTMVVGWEIYDRIWLSSLGKSETAGVAVCFLFVVVAAYGLCHALSGRAAYLHVGALFGTIMFLNVWMRILPAQRKMLAALKDGREPDASLAARAKSRSKHNTFMAVPVVFIMLSNHFPTATYGTSYNWVILIGLILAGWVAAKIIRSH